MSSRPETANYAGSEGMNMKWRLIVYGLLAIALALSTFTSFSINSEREDTEMVVIVNPVNPLNPVVRNPYQEEYEKMLYPTVRISSVSGVGSGVVISHTQIYILTAAHVVENESMVTVEIYSDTGCTIQDAIVVITDTTKDLALLSFSEGISFTATLAPENYKPYIFTPVWAVGCSLGLEPRPSFGHITVIDLGSSLAVSSSSLGLTHHYEISAPILPGNSGGPVFDARTFEVIGIAVWVKVYNGQLITTMGGIVPISEIYKFLEQTPDGSLATGCARK